MATLPDVRNLSSISFEDYVRIKRQLDKDGTLPTEVVSQHDKDNVSFADAYNIMEANMQDVRHYADQVSAYNADLYSSLVTYLVKKKVLTEKEINEIAKVAQQIWQEEIKENHYEA